MIEIAAARESENPEDCGVKLRGIQTIFFNCCLPVASKFAATDSIDSWISVWRKQRFLAQNVLRLMSRSHRSATVWCARRNLRNRTPLTLSALATLGCGGCSRGFGLLGSPSLAFPQLTSPDIDIDVVTAQNAGRATCQRLALSNPLTSPGALSDCEV